MKPKTVEPVKNTLKDDRISSLASSIGTRVFGSGRSHDFSIKIEKMVPGEYQNREHRLMISYSFFQTPFGAMLLASTLRGICRMVFVEDRRSALEDLRRAFPHATLRRRMNPLQRSSFRIFFTERNGLSEIRLHLKGTRFQIKVWEALVRIPFGHVSTYGEIARRVSHPKAQRAVGTAIGNNPVAFLIPCHRVIRSTGDVGSYRWGSGRKLAINAWETGRAIESR